MLPQYVLLLHRALSTCVFCWMREHTEISCSLILHVHDMDN